MKLIRLENQEVINRLAGDEFLQTSFWAKILGRENEELEIWGVSEEGSISKEVSLKFKDDKIIASALIIKKKLFGPFFYYYSPRGPRGNKEALEFLITELKNKKKEAVFLRIEPEERLVEGKGVERVIEIGGKRVVKIKKTLDLQPQKTLLLDLGLSEKELLAAMHQKTRYNLKLATKKGVEISEGTEKDFTEFWRLMKLTGERDAFRLHEEKHYQNLLSDSKHIKLFFAAANGKNIATGLFSFSASRVTYLHGASDNEARNLMAPYLLQWSVIKKAKQEDYKFYDFYGVDEKKWPGVTRFKMGFGGFIKEYPGTSDAIFRPVIYSLYELLRKIRRLIK